MLKTLSVFNLSGGVGKSTLTKEIGYSLAQQGHRVLLIDMDPQGSLTSFLGMGPFPRNKHTVYHAIMENENPIIPAIADDGWEWGFDIAPANSKLALAQMELVVADMRDYRLKNFISQHSDYDYILIDCPPTMDMLSYVSMVASTHILVPIQTEAKSADSTDTALEMVHRVVKVNPRLKLAGFVPTIYDKRRTDHRGYLASINELAAIAPVMTPINDCTLLSKTGHDHRPLSVLMRPNASANELATRNAINAIATHLTTL